MLSKEKYQNVIISETVYQTKPLFSRASLHDAEWQRQRVRAKQALSDLIPSKHQNFCQSDEYNAVWTLTLTTTGWTVDAAELAS